MELRIPNLSLVVLVGPSGSGKSTFARRHFRPTEVLSSDFCRGLVSDDENDQAATKDAFAVLHFIAARRLAVGRLTVVDATNVQPEARKPLVELARQYHCLPCAIVFDLPAALCEARNRERPDRDLGSHVVRQQIQQLRRSIHGLQREGFRHVYVLRSSDEVEAATIAREPLYNDRRLESGPFDIIGDVHGCLDELVELLGKLGYRVEKSAESAPLGYSLAHPEGRRAVFLGDLVDRGPKVVEVLQLVMSAVAAGGALAVPGNHDLKLMRKLNGRNVQITHGLAESLAQLDRAEPGFSKEVARFLDGLVSHYVFDAGRLVVAHAGMPEPMQGRGSGRVRDFALYGETTGETDDFGLPVRVNWAAEYRGRALVVYGHTPVPEPEWLNNTVNVDTGCVFGGKLTALRYPERETVSVPARTVYYQPARPFPVAASPSAAPEGETSSEGNKKNEIGERAEEQAAPLTAQQRHDELLDLADVLGKRIIQTRLHHNVTIREENSAAALEVMSRFAANPKWLVYLPPTMSPPETTRRPDLLEHPTEAFAYYRHEGVPSVVCEEKHMGSRAVVVVCRDEVAARRRFGVVGEAGIVYTRTGRRFFDGSATDVNGSATGVNGSAIESELLERVRRAFGAAGLWDELATDWAVLDCELLPWSAKAQELLRQQYAAVGAAAGMALGESVAALEQARASGREVDLLLQRFRERDEHVARYVAAYRRYCWPVASIADLRLAPFHVLASEGKTHVDRDHVWHMSALGRLAAADPALLVATPYLEVDLTDSASESAGVSWWEKLTAKGGEGMVVKPRDFVARGRRGIAQPAIKCRGREYLRIIYGPEYAAPDQLERLRARAVGGKRSLAAREFALGVEALDRFVRGEPLARVHECVFGVLALESEPIDPRL